MIRPEPRSSIPGSTWRVTRKVPRRWVASISSHCSTVIASTGASVTKPALLTRMSMCPNSASTRATIVRTGSTSATLACTASARRPSASMAAATSRAASSCRW